MRTRPDRRSCIETRRLWARSAYDVCMSEQPGGAEQAARAREERLADIRARTSWDPERDPDPVIRRMYRESQEQLSDELAQRKGA